MIPVYRHLNKEAHVWCNLMLTDISYEFYINFHKCIHQHVYLGVLTPTTKRVNKSNKGCIFQVGTWWVYMGWSQCLRDLVTKLETPQFALYFDILDSCVQ